MSAKTELSRVKIGTPNVLSEAKAELAEKARRLLGYTALLDEVGDIQVRSVFAELGIEPLNKDKVQRYKAKRAKNGAEWRFVELRYYANEVPLFAISRATELKERLPNATFYVEELRYAPRDPDPFLVMAVNGQNYYLDVWDEPDFEGRRTV